MRIRFMSTKGMLSYHDLPHSWADRDQRDIPDEAGARLVADFPDNFELVRGEAPPPKPKPKPKPKGK